MPLSAFPFFNVLAWLHYLQLVTISISLLPIFRVLTSRVTIGASVGWGFRKQVSFILCPSAVTSSLTAQQAWKTYICSKSMMGSTLSITGPEL